MYDNLTYPMAFMNGIMSFFSPCVLPLLPAFFTFITGYSLDELTQERDNKIIKKAVTYTIAYVLGFSSIFILMGASASFVGGYVTIHSNIIRVLGGIVIIILGIHMTGLVPIKILQMEKRLHLTDSPVHILETFVIGMAFAAGWSPCIGPFLASTLIIASSEGTAIQGVKLLAVYSAGLAIPFLIISLFINFVLTFLKKASKVLRYVNMIAGILLILTGIALVTDKLTMITILIGGQ
ncbi:cytochrome c biogenesis CcdA family protein [Desulforegula conservatrix]|uniref:cytochrome c biogenesis CcdA family protein n=1 Tax=Desulforegula conservatrix TaxID=153026 RepID=UPI0003FEA1EF|nr:cytochrome c biogenesis protein CcdA [Desulforegula conservatrix]